MKHLLAIVIMLIASNSGAARHEVTAIAEDTEYKNQLGFSGLYRVLNRTEVVPQNFVLNGEIEGNPGQVSMDLTKDEVIAVKFGPNGQVVVSLKLASEELRRIPERLILSRGEFNRMKLELISFGDELDLQAFTDVEATRVAGGRGQVRSRKHTFKQEARRGRGNIVGRNGNCVSVVKYLTGFSGTAGNGVGMASALQNRGYKTISFSAKKRGTVCSWSGGSHGLGHVGWFDGRCFQPTYSNCGDPGHKYRLLKCVHR